MELDSSQIIGKRILVLTAHPDDESFLAAGTIYENHKANGETYLVCATLGEKGSSHLEEELTPEELQKVRKKELHTACAELGMTKDFILKFPDGKVHEHEDNLLDQASKLCEQLKPELILSFGEDGITGHKDHIAVSKVAKKLAGKFSLPLAMFCIPHELATEAEEWLKTRRKTEGHYDANPTHFQKENITIPINGEVKLRALKHYCSQIDREDPFHGFPAHVADTLLKQECFHLQN